RQAQLPDHRPRLCRLAVASRASAWPTGRCAACPSWCGSRAGGDAPAASGQRRTTRPRRWSGRPSVPSRSSSGRSPRARSSPGKDSVQEQEVEELAPPPCGSVDDVLAVLEDDYRRAYFLTGDFTPGIYTEDCLFEDPTIKFRGRSRYSQNLDLLVPFLDSPSLELENIEKGLRVETKFVKATWKLRTYLRLPWRPLIAIRGNTTYDLNEDYKVVRHSESWDVSALEAIGQIFVSAPEQRKGS
ncbi:unnamed protein product, partial [Urochloa humidicola]